MSRSEHLVTARALRRELAGARPPVLLDVGWRLGEARGAGRQRYAEAHLPGARFLDLETVLTTPSADPGAGRHPLPPVEVLERGLGALGVQAGDDVVVYDEAGSFAAPRAWWVLRWAGIRARVLDGGRAAWAESWAESGVGWDRGADWESGEDMTWTATAPRLTTGQLPTLTLDDAARHPGRGMLVDVRAPERYRGEVEPLDPRAGHIPGSVNLPVGGLIGPAGALLPETGLRSALGGLVDSRDVAAYCGSGVSATLTVLACATLGVEVALFPGSWSAWSSDPALPVATGPDAG